MKQSKPLFWAKACMGFALFLFVTLGANAQTGCTSASNGQYPSTTYEPDCTGSSETITTLAYSGEYSVVSVNNGEPYTFSSSLDSDFITISADETDPEIYTTGTGSVSWTSTVSGDVRFYLHDNTNCDVTNSFRSRIVQCGEVDCPELGENVGASCDDGDSNTEFDRVGSDCSCQGYLPADNDECADATSLTVDAAPITASNIGATGSGTLDNCWLEEDIDNDVWFSFTAPSDGKVTIETFETNEGQELDDTQMQILDACGGNEIGCSDDEGEGYMSVVILECEDYTPGNTYYVRIDGYNGAEGPFDISVTSATCFNCPTLEADIGDSCDDGDPNTSYDTVTENCECEGIPIPDNDEAGQAVALACGSNNAITDSTNGATQSLPPNCGGSEFAPDVWYRFQANGMEDITLKETSGNNNEVEIYSGGAAPSSATSIECVTFGEDNIPLGVLQSGTYYVRVYAYDFSDPEFDTYTLELECEDVACASPDLNLSLVDANGNTINDCLEFDDAFYVEAALSGGSGNSSYSVSANDSDTLDVNSGSSETFGPFTTGTEVDVTATGNDNDVCEATGSIEATACVPDNDECADALPLTVDADPITASNFGATGSGTLDNCWIDEDIENDVWFSFVAPQNGKTVVETFETVEGEELDDTQMQILDACDGVEVGCSDDEGDGFMSVVEFGCGELTPGNTYYVRIDGYSAAEGPFDISVTNPDCPTLPDNNLCSNATPITVNGDTLTGNNTNATADGPVMDCAFLSDPVQGDVFFSFVAPDEGTVIVETLNDAGLTDTQVQILDACGGNVVACDEDGGLGLLSQAVLTCGNYTPGETYYIQVDGYAGATGEFEISVSTVNCLTINTNANCSREISVAIYDAGPDTLIGTVGATGNFITDESGAATIFDLADGSYDLYITVEGYLTKLETIDVTSANTTVSTTLLAGDIDGNNTVTPTDLSSLLEALFSSTGDDNFNDIPDYDCNGSVTPTDLSTLIANLFASGDAVPAASGQTNNNQQ